MLSWSWYHTCSNCSEAIPGTHNRSCMFRPILLTFLGGLLIAQTPPLQQQPPPDPAQPATIFRGGVEVVQAPVLVFDRDGNYVDGLQPFQFHLFDNGKEQNINVDVTYQPISLVICLQANAHVDGILPQVKKIGGLIAPLLIGEQGEAAVIAFDSRIRTLQDFTSDSEKITKAVKGLTAGSNANRMIDSVSAATRMQRTRPTNRRTIILYISLIHISEPTRLGMISYA